MPITENTYEILMPLSVTDALAAYFEKQHKSRFVMHDQPMDAVEVFDPAGFLPVIAHVAEARARILFGTSLRPSFVKLPGALFSSRVKINLGDTDRGVMFLLMLKSAEDVIGVFPNSEIDLYPVYTYFNTPKDQRGEPSWPLSVAKSM